MSTRISILLATCLVLALLILPGSYHALTAERLPEPVMAIDQCQRTQTFGICVKANPSKSPGVESTTWDGVAIAECGRQATRTSMRRADTIADSCYAPLKAYDD